MVIVKNMESDLDICVCNPWTDKFTTYEILIKTSNPAFTHRKSRTRRRYNDFCWLKNILKSHHPCLCPELPEKKKFSERFEPQFVVDRMTKLGEWLSSVVKISLYLSDSALHLFLQTTLTCSQIDLYLKGSLAEEVVAKGYRAAMVKDGDSTTTSPRHSGEPTEQDQSTNAELTSPQPDPETSESAENQSISQNENQSISQNENQSISQNGDISIDHGSDLELSSSLESSPDSSISSSADLGMLASKYPQVTEVKADVKECENDSTLGCLGDATSGCVGDTDSGVFSGEGTTSEENKTISKVDRGVIFSIN